ncbi:MAG: hypothetical protein H0U32_04555 [Thermoleophilaceae bacterium]|nr:hypothetical protein [Thermoleophilaceae bacterium]
MGGVAHLRAALAPAAGPRDRVGGEAGYEHSDPWISFAYLAWVIAFLLGAAVYPRVLKRLEGAVSEHGRASPEAGGHVNTFLSLNTIEITLLLLVVIDMAVKPGA